MNENIVDLRKIDNMYEGFPKFELWQNTPIDMDRWNRNIARLEALLSAPSKALEHARRE